MFTYSTVYHVIWTDDLFDCLSLKQWIAVIGEACLFTYVVNSRVRLTGADGLLGGVWPGNKVLLPNRS